MGLFQSSIHVANASSKTIRARVAQEETRVKEIETSIGLNGPPLSLDASVKATLDYSLDVTGFARIAPQEALEFALTSWKNPIFVSATTADDPSPLIICFNYTPPRNRSILITNNGTIKLTQKHLPIYIPLQPAQPSGSFQRKRGPNEAVNLENASETTHGVKRKNSKKKNGKVSEAPELSTERSVPFTVRGRIKLMTSSEQGSVTSSPAIIVRDKMEERRNWMKSHVDDSDGCDGKKVNGSDFLTLAGNENQVDVNNNNDPVYNATVRESEVVDKDIKPSSNQKEKSVDTKTKDTNISDTNSINTNNDAGTNVHKVEPRDKGLAENKENQSDIEADGQQERTSEQGDEESDYEDVEEGLIGVIQSWTTEEGLCYTADMARRVFNQRDVDKAAAEMRYRNEKRRASSENQPTSAGGLPASSEKENRTSLNAEIYNNIDTYSSFVSPEKDDIIDAPLPKLSLLGENKSQDSPSYELKDALPSELLNMDIELEGIYTIKPNHNSSTFVDIRPTEESIYFKDGGAFRKAQSLRLSWNTGDVEYLIEGITMTPIGLHDRSQLTPSDRSLKQCSLTANAFVETEPDKRVSNTEPKANKKLAEIADTEKFRKNRKTEPNPSDSIRPSPSIAEACEITRRGLNSQYMNGNSTTVSECNLNSTSRQKKQAALNSDYTSKLRNSNTSKQPECSYTSNYDAKSKDWYSSRSNNNKRSELYLIGHGGGNKKKTDNNVRNFFHRPSKDEDEKKSEQVAASFGLVITPLSPK